MKLNNQAFLNYKFFNSTFTGFSIGILFTIYEPLDPSTYSLGGIILALGMLFIAKFYEKLLNIKSFYYISILVEIIMFISLIIFLLLKYSLISALLIYILYQATFIFGNYLVRAETLVAQEKELLSKIDIRKQMGYLIGLTASFIFYESIEYFLEINQKDNQIIIIHYFLIVIQIIVISTLLNSFKKINT